MQVELVHDAASAAQFPTDGLAEVAIIGRSNVGKSTLINGLVARRRLARTSGRPGKTRRIQFYRLEGSAYLVDLPGYGYAAVSREERRAWQPLVESYLRGGREALRGCILLIDVRRELGREESQLLDWLHGEGIAVRVALIKADKLSRGARQERVRSLRTELPRPGLEVALASGRTGEGLGTLASWIREWTGLQLTRADGTALPG